MDLKAKILVWLKKFSSYFQTAPASFKRHHGQYAEPGKLELEKGLAERNERMDLFNIEEYKLGQLLNRHPEVREVAVDIGSGAGWFSYKFSSLFKKVIAIEPSEKALEIAKTLYPVPKYPNIDWRQGFAEQVLSTVNLPGPALFFTGVVLSHLRDKEVAAICGQVNRLAAVGSLLCFNECWGAEYHQLMWHDRTKQWWQEQLPGWQLDFHGPEIEDTAGRHKGFHGIKLS